MNKLSALLVLWVGAYLVLQGRNSPWVKLIRLFESFPANVTATHSAPRPAMAKNFQETALSLERLVSLTLLTMPQEADEDDANQIPSTRKLPVAFNPTKNVVFSDFWAPSGPLAASPNS